MKIDIPPTPTKKPDFPPPPNGEDSGRRSGSSNSRFKACRASPRILWRRSMPSSDSGKNGTEPYCFQVPPHGLCSPNGRKKTL
jgi:hypothetical protein